MDQKISPRPFFNRHLFISPPFWFQESLAIWQLHNGPVMRCLGYPELPPQWGRGVNVEPTLKPRLTYPFHSPCNHILKKALKSKMFLFAQKIFVGFGVNLFIDPWYQHWGKRCLPNFDPHWIATILPRCLVGGNCFRNTQELNSIYTFRKLWYQQLEVVICELKTHEVLFKVNASGFLNLRTNLYLAYNLRSIPSIKKQSREKEMVPVHIHYGANPQKKKDAFIPRESPKKLWTNPLDVLKASTLGAKSDARWWDVSQGILGIP